MLHCLQIWLLYSPPSFFETTIPMTNITAPVRMDIRLIPEKSFTRTIATGDATISPIIAQYACNGYFSNIFSLLPATLF